MDSGINSYRRFLSGDNSALEEIICMYKDGLILYLHGVVNDLHLAEELTEETFVKLVVKRPRFSQQSAFKTWLYTIGRNTAIDHLRRSKKAELPLDDCLQICDEEEDLEQRYILQENKILLHRCMKQLKQEYRQVLWLAYFEGFSYKEIARILHKTTHNIETIAYRARQALKTILIMEGFDYENLS